MIKVGYRQIKKVNYGEGSGEIEFNDDSNTYTFENKAEKSFTIKKEDLIYADEKYVVFLSKTIIKNFSKEEPEFDSDEGMFIDGDVRINPVYIDQMEI